MHTYLRICLIVLSTLALSALAAPTPKDHTQRNVIIEETLKVKGLSANGDIDILEVDKNSNLKGKVRVGENLTVAQGATIDQGATVGQNLDVNQNLNVAMDANIGGSIHVGEDLTVAHDVDVDNDLNVDGDTTLGGNVMFDALTALWDFAGNLNVQVLEGLTQNDLVTYEKSSGKIELNRGKFKYDPVDGISANNGSITLNSTNGNTEFNACVIGETTLQRRTPSKCALKLEEHPDNADTDIDLLVVRGKSNFRDSMRIRNPETKKRDLSEILLTVEGAVEIQGTVNSPGNIKDYSDFTQNTTTGLVNSTAGEPFGSSVSCSGNKVVTGGGCSISGNSTGLVLKQSKPILGEGGAYVCQYVQVKALQEIDATVTATVFCAISVSS